MSGRLFIVSGPSGSGKSSLCAAWLKQAPNLQLSISCTTRKPRPGEVNGREYHFLSLPEFEKQKENGAFLESARVHGNYYGTREADVQAALDIGRDVLLEIDWQGAAQVAARMPGAARIFILPPSIEELRKRLIGRGQDDVEVVERRVAAAEAEMEHADEAQHQVVNVDFDKTLSELLKIYANS